jgi:hypothetical protein
MVVLHIEHPVSDFATWQQAFSSFAARRRQGGVKAERVCRPVDDERYVIIDLDFDTAEQADRFRQFLTSQIWANPENSPALAGQPTTRILNIA